MSHAEIRRKIRLLSKRSTVARNDDVRDEVRGNK